MGGQASGGMALDALKSPWRLSESHGRFICVTVNSERGSQLGAAWADPASAPSAVWEGRCSLDIRRVVLAPLA